MNIGIDFHDTISYFPEFFTRLMSKWDGKIYIVTGTPESKREETVQQLKDVGIEPDDYESLLMGFEYSKDEMTLEHFHHMKKHKLRLLQQYDIHIYFDDNPFYIDYLRNNGVITFQTVLDDKYLDEFENKHNFFTCNLQRGQFDYLRRGLSTKSTKVVDDIS